KIERKLEQAVTSLEERSRTEGLIRQQHKEVINLIEKEPANIPLKKIQLPVAGTKLDPVYEKLSALPGFRTFYRLNNDGEFGDETASRVFKKTYRRIYRDLAAIVELFPLARGGTGLRETGVCEVIPDVLYFVSTGLDCYFVEVKLTSIGTDYEKLLREALLMTPA
ncbi:MAG: hypothetical protein AB1744_09145, partial [Candidatus Zixiibacteriota bacterium]